MSEQGDYDDDISNYDDIELEANLEETEIDDTEEPTEVLEIKEIVEETIKKKNKKIPNSQRTTRPFLSKYERCRVLGIRAKQIDLGCPIYTDAKNLIESYDIAEKELNERKLPFILRRYLPNGNYEDWELSELIY